PLDLIDEVEKVLGIGIVPLTWPIGSGPDFKGVYALDQREVHLFERSVHNAQRAGLNVTGPDDETLTRMLGETAHRQLLTELEMVHECIEPFDKDRFLRGEVSPMFFASALTNFGVE